jgi:hypothetical protein
MLTLFCADSLGAICIASYEGHSNVLVFSGFTILGDINCQIGIVIIVSGFQLHYNVQLLPVLCQLKIRPKLDKEIKPWWP